MHVTCYQYGAALQGFKSEDVLTAVLNSSNTYHFKMDVHGKEM